MQTLHADSLVLEPLTVAHAAQMFDVLSDPAIHVYTDHPPPPSLEHLRDVYRRLEARQSPDGRQAWLNWVLRLDGAAAIGYVQATIAAPGRAWVAYALSSRHWGRGHAHAAVQAMLVHLASAYQVSRCLATVEQANGRSIRLLQRLDFHPPTEAERARHDLSATERLFVREQAVG